MADFSEKFSGKIYDTAIVGGGPAGATLARLLAEKDFAVALFDRKQADADARGFRKPCGGLLAEDAQRSLSRQGLALPKSVLADPQLFSVRTIDFLSGHERTYRRFYINMDRHRFDTWLKSLVHAPATVFNNAIVRRFERIEGEKCFEIVFAIDGNEHRLRARTLVGADGAWSLVRRKLFPRHRIRCYTALQEWFPARDRKPLYACFFDERLTDCYGWAVSKDGMIVFGAAFPPHNASHAYDVLLARAREFGFDLRDPVKTEACSVLRPEHFRDFVLGDGHGVFLIGEAAGLISPSSLEGLSYALDSAEILAEVLGATRPHVPELYGTLAENYVARMVHLRLKLMFKLFKNPFMYEPRLRRLVMASGIASLPTSPDDGNAPRSDGNGNGSPRGNA